MNETLRNILAVGFGGAIGAITRYGLNLSPISKISQVFPFSTFFANVLGSFLIGFLFVFLTARFPDSDTLKLFLLVGVLGGFTTFSSYELEIWTLFEQGRSVNALIYLFTSLILGFFAVAFGIFIARRFV
ncbi:MAG: fluoride efflux transporter CrcB [Pyrinomonadaceae bacterium]